MEKSICVPISNKNLRLAMFKAFDGRCFYTGRELTLDNMVIDHVVPKAKGGADRTDNYVLCDSRINSQKTDKYDEALVERMLFIVKTVFEPKVIHELVVIARVPADILRLREVSWAVCNPKRKAIKPKAVSVVLREDQDNQPLSSRLKDVINIMTVQQGRLECENKKLREEVAALQETLTTNRSAGPNWFTMLFRTAALAQTGLRCCFVPQRPQVKKVT
jgi:hypothetical protein